MLSWLMGCKKVILEVDYEVVVRWLQEETVLKVPMANLIHMCKNEVHKQCEVCFKHIYKETNCVANMLAKTALEGDFGLSYYSIELVTPRFPV